MRALYPPPQFVVGTKAGWLAQGLFNTGEDFRWQRWSFTGGLGDP
jgi:hypothetical protein